MEHFDYRKFQSRKLLAKSFVQLLKEKDFNEISISEICKRSGVSRTTFYRNHKRKEDILVKYLSDWYYTVFENILFKHSSDPDPILTFFKACQPEMHFFKSISKCGLDYEIQIHLKDCVDFFIEHASKDIMNQGNELLLNNYPYSIYAFVGKTYMTIIYWLEHGDLTYRDITGYFEGCMI